MKNILVLILVLLTSITLNAQFAAEYDYLATTSPSTGEYGLLGLFSNSEPVRSNGNVIVIDSIRTDGSHFFIDDEGTVFVIVAKSGNSPLTLEVDNINGESQAPSTGLGQLTSINQENQQYYTSSSIPNGLKAKIQRINVDDLIAGITEIEVRNITNDSLETERVNRENQLADSLNVVRAEALQAASDSAEQAEILAQQLFTNLAAQTATDISNSSDSDRAYAEQVAGDSLGIALASNDKLRDDFLDSLADVRGDIPAPQQPSFDLETRTLSVTEADDIILPIGDNPSGDAPNFSGMFSNGLYAVNTDTIATTGVERFYPWRHAYYASIAGAQGSDISIMGFGNSQTDRRTFPLISYEIVGSNYFGNVHFWSKRNTGSTGQADRFLSAYSDGKMSIFGAELVTNFNIKEGLSIQGGTNDARIVMDADNRRWDIRNDEQTPFQAGSASGSLRIIYEEQDTAHIDLTPDGDIILGKTGGKIPLQSSDNARVLVLDAENKLQPASPDAFGGANAWAKDEKDLSLYKEDGLIVGTFDTYGTGLAGYFRITTSPTTSNASPFTAIDLGDGFFAEPSADKDGFVNAVALGFVQDSTVASVHAQTGILFAAERGYNVYIPKGVYYTESTLACQEGMTIKGEDREKTVIKGALGIRIMSLRTGADISGLTFTHRSYDFSNTGGSGLHLGLGAGNNTTPQGTDVKIQNCAFEGIGAIGVSFAAVNRVVFRDNIMRKIGRGGFICKGCKDVTVTDNFFYETGDDAIGLIEPSDKSIIANNYIFRGGAGDGGGGTAIKGASGIKLHGVHAVVDGNIMEECDQGIYLKPQNNVSSSNGGYAWSKKIIISNNIVKNLPENVDPDQAALFIDGGGEVLVTGNYFSGLNVAGEMKSAVKIEDYTSFYSRGNTYVGGIESATGQGGLISFKNDIIHAVFNRDVRYDAARWFRVNSNFSFEEFRMEDCTFFVEGVNNVLGIAGDGLSTGKIIIKDVDFRKPEYPVGFILSESEGATIDSLRLNFTGNNYDQGLKLNLIPGFKIDVIQYSGPYTERVQFEVADTAFVGDSIVRVVPITLPRNLSNGAPIVISDDANTTSGAALIMGGDTLPHIETENLDLSLFDNRFYRTFNNNPQAVRNQIVGQKSYTVSDTSELYNLPELLVNSSLHVANQNWWYVVKSGVASPTNGYDEIAITDFQYLDLISTGGNLGNKVIITQASDFPATLEPDKVYEVHGTVDMGSTSIEIPATGATISGLGPNVSTLSSSEDNYTLFAFASGGSGNLFIKGLDISVSGTNSAVFELQDVDDTNALEIIETNFTNCSSLGTVDGYRQGYEGNTGRFGGTPTLTFTGTWAGGYRVENSIVRGVGPSTTLYSAGVGLTMGSRFRANSNVVLPDGAEVCDFSPSNIVNDGDFQIDGGEFSGLSDRTFYFPNMPVSSTKAFYRDNSGIQNTFVGAVWEVSSETLTGLSGSNYSRLAGTITGKDTVHFSVSSPNAFVYNSTVTRDVSVTGNITVDGGANDVIRLILRHWDDSAGAYVDGRSQVKTINNIVGAGDIAEYFLYDTFELDKDDRIEVWGRNETDDTDITMLDSSILTIKSR